MTTKTTVPPEWPQSGRAKLALVGEAPGTEEELLGRPFVGPSGRLLNSMLWRAGVSRRDCLVTNVFDFRLTNNDITSVCAPQPDGTGPLAVPPATGAYVQEAIGGPQLARLRGELERSQPGCIIALGATAVWALLGIAPSGKMQKLRGTVHPCALASGLQVVVTYHPAYVLRSWTNKTFVEADLQKAARVADGTYRPLNVQCQQAKTPQDVEDWFESNLRPGAVLSVDIETARGGIDSIGFCCDGEHSLFVQFYDVKTGTHSWQSAEDEAAVMLIIARVLEDPTVAKVGHNFAYDTWWIRECWGIGVRGWTDDTRTLHHTLFPDLPKALADLAATHLNLPAWKHQHAETKRDT